MAGPGGGEYDNISGLADDGYESSVEGLGSSRKKIEAGTKIALADPHGVLGIHFKELRLLPWNPDSLFDSENIDIYFRIIVAEKVKWTCVLDGLSFPSTRMIDDLKHVPVDFNVNNLEDARNRISIELVGYDRPDLHHVISRKHIHIFSIVKHMYARDTLQMKRAEEIVAEVDIDFCFSYGLLGYGYANQLESKELTPGDYILRSMFCRLEPPPNRCEDTTKDVMDCKYVGHPAYIPFTCVAKNLGNPYVAFGPNASLQPELVAEPTMVVTRIRERLHENMRAYSQQPSRKERIEWLRQYVFNSQLADTTKEEISIPEGSAGFRRKQLRKRANAVTGEMATMKVGAATADEGITQEAIVEDKPAAQSFLERIKSWFGYGPPGPSQLSVFPEIPVMPVTSQDVAARRLSVLLESDAKKFNVKYKGTKVQLERDSVWRRIWRQLRSWASHVLRWHTSTQEEVELKMSESERNVLNAMRRHSLHAERERKGSILTQCDDPLVGVGASTRRHSVVSGNMKMTSELGETSGVMPAMPGFSGAAYTKGSKIHPLDVVTEHAERVKAAEFDEEESDYEDDDMYEDAAANILARDTTKDMELRRRKQVVAEINVIPKDETEGITMVENDKGIIVNDTGREPGIQSNQTVRVIHVKEAESRDTDGEKILPTKDKHNASKEDSIGEISPTASSKLTSRPDVVQPLRAAWSSGSYLVTSLERLRNPESFPANPVNTRPGRANAEDFVDYVMDLSSGQGASISHGQSQVSNSSDDRTEKTNGKEEEIVYCECKTKDQSQND